MRVAKPTPDYYCQTTMALADRTYMRDDPSPVKVTTVMVVLLIVAFCLQCFATFYAGYNPVLHLGMTLEALRHGEVWRLITFQFLHQAPQPWHVLFNCLGLYFFGRLVEERLGTKVFLWVYFVAGVAGGLLQALATWVLPQHADGPLVGASAGVCGIMAIFCSMDPTRPITAWISFIPVNIQARFLLWFLAGLSLFGTFFPFDQVAHAAHLGGILIGLAYIRWFMDENPLRGFLSRLRFPRRSRPIVKVRFPKAGPEPVSSKTAAPEEGADFITKEVDPILEKISAHGIHSLTERERKILEAARSRIGRP